MDNSVNANEERKELVFYKAEIESLIEIKQDFLDGKTTARNWIEIEEELDVKYK